MPERPHCFRLVASLCVLIACAAATRADTVSLIDGRTIEGKLTLDTKSGFVIVPRNQPSRRVELTDLLALSMDGRKVKPPRRMIRFVNGGQIAAEDVLSMNEREIRIKRPDASLLTFSPVVVSAIDYRPAEEKPLPPGTFVGVQSVRGDLAEGDITQISAQQVSLSSVLFGIQQFDTNTAVQRVQLRPGGVSKASYVVQTVDGSIYHAESLRVERGKAYVGTEFAGELELAGDVIRSIELGPGSTESLAQLTSADADGSVTLKPDESRELKLDGKYAAVLLTVQVPARFAPTRSVRFIVELDGKEIAKSDPLTALDPAKALTLPVEGGKVLRLRMTADGPAQLGTAIQITTGRAIRRG